MVGGSDNGGMERIDGGRTAERLIMNEMERGLFGGGGGVNKRGVGLGGGWVVIMTMVGLRW